MALKQMDALAALREAAGEVIEASLCGTYSGRQASGFCSEG